MIERQNGYRRGAVVSGWAITVLYLAHALLTMQLARSDRFGTLRETLRGWHYLAGSLMFAAVVWRFVEWRREGPVAAPAGVSAPLWHWGRTMAFLAWLLILCAPLLGVLFAWSDGLHVHIGPFATLPDAMGRDHDRWLFTGYFHSAIGFTLIFLNLAALLTAAYAWLRYGRGLWSVLPPGYGAMALGGMAATVYAFATFRSPAPGPRALAIFFIIVAVIWGVGKRLHRQPRQTSSQTLSPIWRMIAPVAAVCLAGLGAYGPHALFRVSPWPVGTTIAAPAGVTSHLVPAQHVVLPPETAFERQVRADTYKWCRFCHSVEKNGPHLAGPNLYLVFGQRAGTAPNFGYTDAMTSASKRGLVWDDKTVAAYIADPQAYMPGTAMIISSGPIRDPKVQAAIVAILKRDTAEAAAQP